MTSVKYINCLLYFVLITIEIIGRQEVIHGVPTLKREDVVLARWSDDGWYYFGKVFSVESNNNVHIIDINGYTEKIRMEDILVTDESRKESVRVSI